jgi:HlyD family secretion protein
MHLGLQAMHSELHKLRIDKADKASRHEKSPWPWVLGAVVLLGAGAGVWQWHGGAAIPVRTVRVRTVLTRDAQPQHVVFNAVGYVMAAHKIELASKVIGRVEWVGVEMADKIEKDQVLVRLEDDDYKARVAQQQGQLDSARALLAELEAGSRPQEIATAKAKWDQAVAELSNAESNLKRLRSIEGTNGVSQQQVDDADALAGSRRAQVDAQQQQYEMIKLGPRKEEIDAQRATVRQLEGALANLTIDLNNTVIRSPIAATVLERNVEVGEFVTNGFVGDRGAKGYVLSIADLNDLRVELDVSQKDFAKVSPGQPCSIVTDAYPDKKYAGVVDLISPEANRQKATVQVRVKVLTPDGLLRPDMDATVSFLSQQVPASGAATQPVEHSVVRIPATAIREGAVFVVENGKAVKRPVESQKSGEREMEIRKGLIGGEDLILSPPDAIQDGVKVSATEASQKEQS